jgi:hypothetical protein
MIMGDLKNNSHNSALGKWVVVQMLHTPREQILRGRHKNKEEYQQVTSQLQCHR